MSCIIFCDNNLKPAMPTKSPANQITCQSIHLPIKSPANEITCQPNRLPTKSPANQFTCQSNHLPMKSPANQITSQSNHQPTNSPANQIPANQTSCQSNHQPIKSPVTNRITCQSNRLSPIESPANQIAFQSTRLSIITIIGTMACFPTNIHSFCHILELHCALNKLARLLPMKIFPRGWNLVELVNGVTLQKNFFALNFIIIVILVAYKNFMLNCWWQVLQ